MKKNNLIILIFVLFIGIDLNAQTIKDCDSNVYRTVKIGYQVWMAENLKTTKYNDGTPIPLVTDNTAWSNLTTPGYCWYKNDSLTYSSIYGALYNSYAANTDKLCPSGWHVPSDDEWATLDSYVSGSGNPGGKLKETGTKHWNSPNTDATNKNGFTALPGGQRSVNGEFSEIGSYAYFYSDNNGALDRANARRLSYNDPALSWIFNKKTGYSVRCIKD